MLFPSSKKSHFQNEAKCETFVVKMSFISMTIKNHFHINGFALNLALKVRLFGTRKWPIVKGVMISCKQVVNKFQGDHKSWIPVKINVIVLLAIPVLLLV